VSPVNEQLRRVYAAVDYLSDLEGQDHTLVLEMSLAMLRDLVETDGLAPLVEYIARYCDVAGNRADVERFAAEIEAGLR
jgi:hypothetical protein